MDHKLLDESTSDSQIKDISRLCLRVPETYEGVAKDDLKKLLANDDLTLTELSVADIKHKTVL